MGNEYTQIGLWFGVPTALITWVACLIYAINEFGWFIGTPLGFFVGVFFAGIAGAISAYLWPLIALGIAWLILQ